jgi:hypothetical protein
VSLAGGTSTIYDQTTLIIDGAAYTYIVFGTTAAPLVQVLTDQIVQGQPPAAGTFRLRISNAAITSASFDVYVTQPGELLANMSPSFSSVAYGTATTFTTFNAATLQIRITLPGSKQVIYDAGPIKFNEQIAYQLVGYTRGSSTLVNGALLVIDNRRDELDRRQPARPGEARPCGAEHGPRQRADRRHRHVRECPVSERVELRGHFVRNAHGDGRNGECARRRHCDRAAAVTPATDTSVVLMGVPGAQTVTALTDTNLPGAIGRARVRFVNAGSDVGPVDVLVNFAKVFSNVGNGAASTYIEELEDSYTITFDYAGTTSEILSVPGGRADGGADLYDVSHRNGRAIQHHSRARRLDSRFPVPLTTDFLENDEHMS